MTGPAGTFESSPVPSAGKSCERHARPARDDRKRSALDLPYSLTNPSILPFGTYRLEKTNPALRTRLLSNVPTGLISPGLGRSLYAFLIATYYVDAHGQLPDSSQAQRCCLNSELERAKVS